MKLISIFFIILHFLCGTGSYIFAQSIKIQDPIRISAHRGNTGLAPENTLATCKNALKLRLNFIEIDVRTSADGQLVILHDETLNRTTNGKGLLKNFSFADLRKLSAANGMSAFSKEKIPSLEEVCQLISKWNRWHFRKTFLYVDCKDVTASPLIDILQKYNLAHESCYFGNDSFLLSLKNEYHEARLMPSISKKEDISWKISLLHPYAFDANWNTLSPEIVKEVHANNIQLFVDLLGPKDNVENYRKAAIMGVDLVQTDKPLLLLKTLRN